MNLKPIGVKITRAEKRNRKIIIVIEPDLFSDEEFAVNEFYNEGPEKNKLQETRFYIDVAEAKGKVKANVHYGGEHYTTGHTQIHSLDKMFISRKDGALNWAMTETEKYLNDKSRKNQALDMWNEDPDFRKELESIIVARKKGFAKDRLDTAKANYKQAMSELDHAISEI